MGRPVLHPQERIDKRNNKNTPAVMAGVFFLSTHEPGPRAGPRRGSRLAAGGGLVWGLVCQSWFTSCKLRYAYGSTGTVPHVG